MSTSYLTDAELMRWANRLGLLVKLVGPDPYDPHAEFRITRGSECGELIFQGTLTRCSDFIKGFLHGDAKGE